MGSIPGPLSLAVCTAEMTGLDYSSGSLGFPFLAQTFPGKHDLGAAQGCQPDVANWKALTVVAGPNGLSDQIYI